MDTGIRTMKLSRFVFALAVSILLVALVSSSAGAASAERPNIIFILADDISPKEYAFYGGKTASPVLSKMAEKPWFVYMPLNLPHWVRNPDNPQKWGPPVVPELDENWKKTGKLVQNDFEACIRYIDYKIGGFIEHLKATGQLENTVIMYAGDNGSNQYGKSNPDSEKGPRVPFVVYAPGRLEPMGACDELVDFADVIPTCVELAGGTLPKGDIFDGHSFAPLILGKPFEGREWIFSQWYGCRWLRTKQWLIDGRGRFYNCGDERNEWVPRAYEDVTESTDERVTSVRKNMERILEKLPAPDYDDPQLAKQWKKDWLNTKRFVKPYEPPYLKKTILGKGPRLLFATSVREGDSPS